jgi:hypothetical protein
MSKQSAKKAIITFLISVLALSSGASFAADSYVSNSETPQGFLSMAWADDILAHDWPVSYVRSIVNSNGGNKTCLSFDDPKCTDPNMDSKLLLEPCKSDSTFACIEGFSVGPSKSNLTTGNFVRMIEGDRIPASKKYGTPAGGSIGIWEVPGQNHTGGTNQYSVAVALSYSANKDANSPATLTNFQVSVIPFITKAGNYQRMYIGDVPNVNPPATAGMWSYGDCSWQEPDKCAVAQLWSENSIASIKIRVPNQATGWLYGRVKDPTISVSKINDTLNLLEVSGSPTLVQGKKTLVDIHNIPKTLLDVITRNGEAPLPTEPGYINGGYGWVGLPPDMEYSKKWFDAWLPLTKNTADGMSEFWNLKAIPSDSISNKCLKSTSNFVGLVTSNSMLYSSTAPEFSKDELTYQVTSLHYLPDGITPFLGSYDLILRSDAARCLYGFSNAPVKATIQVLGESTDNQIITTVMNENDGWLHLAARGFQYSSPSIHVKLLQEAPTPTPTATPTPTPTATPTPTPTATPTPTPTPAPTTRTVYLNGSNSKITIASGEKVVVGLKTIGIKAAQVALRIQDSTKKIRLLSTQSIGANKSYISQPIAFSRPGTFKLILNVGSTQKTLTVNITR